jgi:hypothetical protein
MGCIGLDSKRAGSRTLEKSSRLDRDRDCAKFENSRRFRGSNMNPKKKSRRCRGLGLDSGLDLAISRFIHSLVCNTFRFKRTVCSYMYVHVDIFRYPRSSLKKQSCRFVDEQNIVSTTSTKLCAICHQNCVPHSVVKNVLKKSGPPKWLSLPLVHFEVQLVKK